MTRFRKIFRVSLISLLVLAALMASFHFWLIAHAQNILAEIVRVQSGGRYRLEVEKVKYDYLKLRLELHRPVFTNVDTSNTRDRFEMHTQYISLKLEKLWPLISGRHLLIDSISMDNPVLSLLHQKRSGNQMQKTPFSLSVEMEKLYQSIQSVLTTLKVGNFSITKGAFILNSGSKKNTLPLEIKNIDFYIKGFNIDSATISQHPNSYTEDIQLKIAGQTIHFPDGDKSIRFSSFRFVANKGIVEADSCSISGGDNDSTKASFNLFAEKMRIKNVYLAVNDSTDYNRIDSLFFTKPKVSFYLQIKDAKDSSATIATAIKKITSATFGRLLVRYVSINNVDFDIEVERKEKLSTFNFVQDSLVVSNLGIGLFPSMPLSASSIRFGVKEFVDYFRDSTYLVHFDSVRINNDQFSLSNISIESTARVKKGHQKIFIPILQIEGIDWFQLISQKKLVASDFTLYDPFISITAAGDSKNKTLKKNNNLDRLLRQVLVLKNITVINGSVNYAFSGDEYVNAKNVNTFLVPGLTTGGSLASLQKMVRNFNMGELIYMKNGWALTAKHIIFKEHNTITAAGFNLTNSLRNLRVIAADVSITGLPGRATLDTLEVNKLSWRNATIGMDLSKNQPANAHSLLSIGKLSGGSTDLKLFNDKVDIEAKISTLQTGGIIIENGKPKEMHDLFAEGSAIKVSANSGVFNIGKFIIKDKLASTVSSVTASFPISERFVVVSIPQVNFQTDVQQSLLHALDIGWLRILQPKIDIKINPSFKVTDLNKRDRFPEINVRNMEITNPLVSYQNNSERQHSQLQWGNLSIAAAGIKTIDDGRQLTVNDLQVQSKSVSLNNKDSLQIFSPGVLFVAKAFNMYADSITGPVNWQLLGGGIDVPYISMLNKRRSGKADTLELHAMHLSNLSLNKKDIADPVNYFTARQPATFSNADLSYKNDKIRVIMTGLKGSNGELSLDSFSYQPQMDKSTFMAAQHFQKDYITLKTGAVFMHNFDAVSWLKDTVLKAGHVHISNVLLSDSRDTHLPMQTDIVKALPVKMIKNLPLKTLIDSVSIGDGSVSYHQVSDKTNQTGKIRFTRLKATIGNIKSYNLLPNDSLQVQAAAYFMDTAYIKLRMKETYTDTLATFSDYCKQRRPSI